ncbi:MAG: glycosyltransferase family 2 protein [Bacteroidales bacterium]|jgi:hypothetical protein|nr:glycosyltransferase family 2 protein [Bacteroidales bacterium]
MNKDGLRKVAVITMARNDEFFLNRWISYYGEQFGEENLYVYLDGEDQPVPAKAGKANVIHVPRVAEHVVKAEKRRLGFLSQRARELFNNYDIVIGVDADEFVVIDPLCGKTLHEYLSEKRIKTSVSALGVDMGQDRNSEKILNREQPFLQQRNYAVISSRYTKPSIIAKSVRWGSGFHRVKHHNFHIDKNLYMFHFGSVDYDMIMDRFKDKDRMATGREGHIKKRLRSITFITEAVAQNKAKDGNKYLPKARLVQTIFRPIYAYNKPSMLRWKLIVQIPERFKKILL